MRTSTSKRMVAGKEHVYNRINIESSESLIIVINHKGKISKIISLRELV